MKDHFKGDLVGRYIIIIIIPTIDLVSSIVIAKIQNRKINSFDVF